MTSATAYINDDGEAVDQRLANVAYAMTVIVGLVVLVVSSYYLHEYAVSTKMPEWLSWSLVVALDAGGAGGTLCWVAFTKATRSWGRSIALANLGGSLLGNILGHLLGAGQITSSAWLTILTAAVYPAELWAMVHLALVLRREQTGASRAVPQPATTPLSTPVPAAQPLPQPMTPAVSIPPQQVVIPPRPAPPHPTTTAPVATTPRPKPQPAPTRTNQVTTELLNRGRALQTDRATKGLPKAGRRVLMTELGITDRVARALGSQLDAQPNLEAVA
jgi:hypothetical protein